jgi:hypothetical protein
MVHTELKVRPAPDKLSNVICYKKKGNECDKEGKETPLAGTGTIGRREFWESVEAFERCGCDRIYLVKKGKPFQGVHSVL